MLFNLSTGGMLEINLISIHQEEPYSPFKAQSNAIMYEVIRDILHIPPYWHKSFPLL